MLNRFFRIVCACALISAVDGADAQIAKNANEGHAEIQELRRQIADQQKQIDELRLMLLDQKKSTQTSTSETPRMKGIGEVASLTPMVPPSPAPASLAAPIPLQ